MAKNIIDRSFRIVELDAPETIHLDHAEYHGKRPGQAALKAFNWYCRKSGVKTCKTKFVLEEMTSAENSKKFEYIGERKQLEIPKEIKRDGKSYLVHYSSTVHKA